MAAVESKKGYRKRGIMQLSHSITFIGMFAIIVIIALFRFNVFSLTVVKGCSMNDTLYENDMLVLISNTSIIKDGDIIVFNCDKLNENLVKRVIAKSDETIQIKDNKVYINNNELNEKYIKEDMVTADIKKTQIDKNSYFCMGDNRNNSLDSRSLEVGQVKKSDIVGKVFINLGSLFGMPTMERWKVTLILGALTILILYIIPETLEYIIKKVLNN